MRVFCPLYSAIDQSMREKFYYIKNAYVRLGSAATSTAVSSAMRQTALPIISLTMSITSHAARSTASTTTQSASRTTPRRYARHLPDLEAKPDVINCNDWQTALDPGVATTLMFAARPSTQNIKTVFTIHNIAVPGRATVVRLWRIVPRHWDDAHFRVRLVWSMDGDVNLMKGGYRSFARLITTVSARPTPAKFRPNTTATVWMSVLRMNSYKLHGILNGINMDAFNPETDSKIFKNYGPNNPQDKLVNKTELLKLLRP